MATRFLLTSIDSRNSGQLKARTFTAGRWIPVAAVSLALALALGGCSNRQMYEALQQSEQQECQKNHPHARERCLREVSQPYEEFREDREDLIRENIESADEDDAPEPG